MNVFIPRGARLYHVQFRVRDRTRPTGWRQVLRSCGTDSCSTAKSRAAEIFVEEASRGKKGISRITGAAEPDRPSNQEASSSVADPYIADVIALHELWMKSAIPGERRPSISTARNYRRRLAQLCRMLQVETVGQLAAGVKGLTPTRLGVSEANFIPLVRGAAGVFRRNCMEHYAAQGLHFAAPLKSGPKIRVNEFVSPPTAEQLEALKKAAGLELKPAHVREYLAFLVILHAGCRAQEATHLRWSDVVPLGIRVAVEAGSCTALPDRERYQPKSGQSRTIPVDPDILAELNQYRQKPSEFVIPLRKSPRWEGYVPKNRCQPVLRRLASWLRAKLTEFEIKHPNHWMRKVFGSVVAKELGIPHAGEYLGHAKGSPVTAQTYVALLSRPAVRIGFALPDPREAPPSQGAVRPNGNSGVQRA